MGDLIRREDVEKAIQGLHVGNVRFFEMLRKNIDAIPSAEPERKNGRWVEKQVVEGVDPDIPEWQVAKCSVCGKYLTTPYLYHFDNYEFCPNCGADMREFRLAILKNEKGFGWQNENAR